MMEASIDMAVKILVIVMEEAVEVGSLGVGPQYMDLGAVESEGGGKEVLVLIGLSSSASQVSLWIPK